MDNSPYQVLGISPHKLYGRHHDLTKFLSRLHKARPEHISLVGHRGFGKSVFLRAVAEQAVNKTFAACIYWDLKRCSINSDSDFYKQFAIELAGPMRTIHPELAKLLSGQDTEMFETLNIVFETLEEESKTLLIILDGIDEILLEEGLSKNLWDHLRSLAERSSACFVTATRRRLRELLAGDSRTSPFWNIFSDTPTILSSFSDADWIEILAPFENAKIAFSTGARTELINWTGGVPLLVAALCRYVWQHCDQGTTLTNEEINEFGDKCYEDFEEYFQLLWDDCTEDQRGDFVNLVEKGSLPSTSMAARSRTGLKERGFIKEASATLKPSCRFMERYARDYGSRSSYIRLLFAADSDFENNIKSTLQLRFEQTDKLDSELRDYLRQSIDSLGKPVMVVNPIRAFANRILDIALAKMFSSNTIPQEWIDDWNSIRSGPNLEFPSNKIPSDRGKQISIIKYLGDERRLGETTLSKAAQQLLTHLYFVGNYGQHLEHERPTPGFCVALCFAALELATYITDWSSSP